MNDSFRLLTSQDVRESLKRHRDTYNSRGKFLGWKEFHKHYSMQLGNCTDWTGFPRSGKTELMMELLMNTSKWYGWSHLIYFPDVGSSTEIVADLLHKKTGKTFNPKMDNVITDQEIQNELEWILHHFKILTKKDHRAPLSPMTFWDIAVDIKKKQGLETAAIDSWKDMNHPYAEYGGYATYLEYALPYRNRIAEDHGLHLHQVIHPKLTEKEKGKRRPPTPYDLKGGSEWFNSGKCMITVHREDMSDNRADIYFHKIKPRSVGFPGKIEMRFDKDKSAFFNLGDSEDPNQFIKQYAAPWGQMNEEISYSVMNPKMSFGETPNDTPF